MKAVQTTCILLVQYNLAQARWQESPRGMPAIL